METKAVKNLKLVQEFYETIQAKKALEKKYDELKAEIKSVMGDEKVLLAGRYMVSIKEQSRTSLDKDKLVAEEGQEFVDSYSKTSSYEVFNCQRTS